MLKVVKKENVVDYKSKQQKAVEWLQEVIQHNFKESKNIESACIFWVEKKEDGKFQPNIAYFDMPDTEDFDYIKRCLSDFILNRKFDDYLKEHIGDYLEYVND